MLFENKIRKLRDEQGVLQRHLAALLEIDTPMFSKIERGDRRAKREHRANKKKQPASGIFTPLSVSLGASGLISPRRQNSNHKTVRQKTNTIVQYGHDKTLHGQIE